MSKLSILNLKGEKVGDITLNKDVWEIEPNNTVLYDAIRLSRNSTRQGTSDTKTRSEVSGGGRKPWRQKGTGRARQGSTRSPQWPGGGIVFGPHPRDYILKMNRKERKIALKSALAYKVLEKQLIVVDNFKLETNKTSNAAAILENLKIASNVLIVVDELDDNMILATRNLNNVTLITSDEINTLDIVSNSNMIVTEAAVKKLEEVLA